MAPGLAADTSHTESESTAQVRPRNRDSSAHGHAGFHVADLTEAVLKSIKINGLQTLWSSTPISISCNVALGEPAQVLYSQHKPFDSPYLIDFIGRA
jgi:hypothetical protein